ncbi:cell division protein SepF [Pseudoalteromonas sp. KJ10-2]|uniref:cell division protein SepF n=1 Tax=Psychromonas sp. KJ10-2 TaxID=3391822 RepID=UPI0039B41A48
MKPEFTTLEGLQSLICKSLSFENISDLAEYDKNGIIAIDNIENIDESEKIKILDFIKSVPRTVQFILTSRNEEQCEEKIHVEEFRQDPIGLSFIEEIIESEGFNLDLTHLQIQKS